MKFLNEQLDNGLEIVAECNDDAHSTSVGFFVRTGSRDESDEIAGVSHFLEHMAFKGTPRRTADDVNRQFDEIGAHYNAFTSEESTVFYAAVLPEYQEASVDLLADILRPSLRSIDFDMEKKVIVEEIQMYLDQPPYGMDDHIKQLHLPDHPLARSVLGTADSIAALSVEQMQSYFDSRYTPANIFVAAAGRVDFPRLVDDVQRLCGDWPRAATQRRSPPPVARPTFEVVRREQATQEYLLQLAVGPAAEDNDRYAAKLLATVVGDDSGSRMYWDFVDPGHAESATLGHYEYLGAGMYFTWLSCTPESADRNLQALDDLYKDVEQEGITEEELQQAKSKVKARVVLGGERPRNRLFNVGGNWMHRREYRSVKDDLAAIDEIQLDAVHQVLQKHPFSRHTTVAVGPREEISRS